MENKVSLKLSFYGGAGIGLLFGVIMGTSITPLVSTLFGTLTTLLAAILGLNDKYFTNAKAVRIGSFGFACVVGAYFGLFVRTHNLFSPSLFTLKEKYIALGLSEEQSLNFIVQKEFGALLQTAESVEQNGSVDQEGSAENSAAKLPVISNLAIADTHISKQHSSVLFSAPVELSGCDELEYTDDSLALDEILNNFELTGGVWEQLAVYLTTEMQFNMTPELIAASQKLLLLTIKEAVCKVETVQESSCEALAPELTKTNYQAVLTSLKNYSPAWKKIASTVDLSALSESEKLDALRLAKNTLCGF